MDDKEKEEYDREEREDEWRQEQEDYADFGKCEKCGTRMRYECISSDADGNRQEMGYVCPKCD